MKLATLKDGSRDGQLVVVSRDLGSAHYATGIAHRLQQVLDDWGYLSPQLQDLYDSLNAGRARHAFPFDPQHCLAPLPRAYQCLQASAYPHHAQLAQEAGAASVQGASTQEPLLEQLASDALQGPCEDIVVESAAMDIDAAAALAVVTGDVARASTAEQALEGVRLLMLASAMVLRGPQALERERGQGPLLSRPATAFSPVAVTPDELGPAWAQGRVHLTVQTALNGRKLGLCEAGPDMGFHFGQLIAQACRTRALRAGSILLAGPVSNPPVQDAQGRRDWPRGVGCLAEKRWIETLQGAKTLSPWLQSGDTLRIDMKGRDGLSLCGAIEQSVVTER
jgi:fumarylacetoacetate (FAA) hydrolase